ncbi:MAG: B12-binding domain-containing radical SAM protein, partial [Planctomycetota bacterium]
MSELDCLLIHTPKFDNYYEPAGHFTWVNYTPMGMLGLADYLERNGHACKILHQGVEWMNDKSWQLEDSLASVDPPLIALSLHWHHQAYDVIETCKKIRALRPATLIALGGFTASFFHEELVRNYDCIDAVLRGDAEIPLLTLVRRLKEGKTDLGDVPNLTWRTPQGELVANQVTYCGTQEMLDGICFSNMELLHDYRTYVDYVTFPFTVLKYVPKEVNYRRFSIRRKLFPVTLGRGCPLNCTWCAGSFDPQKERISFREKVVWRDYDAVIADIKKAMDYGYEAVYSVFDPTPQPEGQEYFIGLFRRIRAEGLARNLGWMHEATGLTSKVFADEFANTFSDDFRILGISPETGNEQVRRMNKGYYYSNRQLYEMLDHFAERNIKVEVYLTYGIPGEN